MVKTIVLIPPKIKLYFSKYLLLWGTLECYKLKLDHILERAKKKIREIDVGKRRRFNELLKEFFEVYESKQNEQADYEAALKQKGKERPRFSTSGTTMQFKRVEP